jgi:hypothetical protein
MNKFKIMKAFIQTKKWRLRVESEAESARQSLFKDLDGAESAAEVDDNTLDFVLSLASEKLTNSNSANSSLHQKATWAMALLLAAFASISKDLVATFKGCEGVKIALGATVSLFIIASIAFFYMVVRSKIDYNTGQYPSELNIGTTIRHHKNRTTHWLKSSIIGNYQNLIIMNDALNEITARQFNTGLILSMGAAISWFAFQFA